MKSDSRRVISREIVWKRDKLIESEGRERERKKEIKREKARERE